MNATGYVNLRSVQDQHDRALAEDLGPIVESLACAVQIRDLSPNQHVYRSTILANACLDRIDPRLAADPQVNFGFMLHDVGTIGLPDAILNKPGPLTDGEWAIMKTHPEMGARIVEPVGFSSRALDVILFHHESWNGSGYPQGLAGDVIPLAARVFAVADAYDAMTSPRPYRAAMTKEDALTTIASLAGSRFDPYVVDVFMGLTRR